MLKHVSFVTSNINRILTFYRRLGGKVNLNVTTYDHLQRGVITFGSYKLQFFEIPDESPTPHHHWAEHIALYVHDLAAILSELKADGVIVTRELQLSSGGNKMAFVLDPDGRHVELLEEQT